MVARADDVINVAGHRLSTAAIEDVVLKHTRVADAVVVGAPDPTKGDVPLCLYVMRPPLDSKYFIFLFCNSYIMTFFPWHGRQGELNVCKLQLSTLGRFVDMQRIISISGDGSRDPSACYLDIKTHIEDKRLVH